MSNVPDSSESRRSVELEDCLAVESDRLRQRMVNVIEQEVDAHFARWRKAQLQRGRDEAVRSVFGEEGFFAAHGITEARAFKKRWRRRWHTRQRLDFFDSCLMLLERLGSTRTRDVSKDCERLRSLEADLVQRGRRATALRAQTEKLIDNANHVLDLDGFDVLLLDQIQGKMVSGKHDETRLNLAALEVLVEEARRKHGLGELHHNRLRERLWSMGAFVHYRMGDADEQVRYLEGMRRLNAVLKDDRLTAKILTQEHYQCLTADSALEAIELIESKSGREAGQFGVSRVRVFASEVTIHRGGDIGSRIPRSGRLTVQRAIEEAYEAERSRNDLDSAMRFRTVPIRAAIWNGRIGDAIETANRVEAELEEHELTLGKPLLHVQLRIAIDRSAAWYVEWSRTKMDSAEAEWQGQLDRALRIAERLQIPVLSDAHVEQYGKIMPPLEDAEGFKRKKIEKSLF